MPLRLITGPANAGKTGIVLKEALAAADAGASPIIAVPNLADVRRVESELSGKAPLGVRVLTLPQMANELWSLHGDGSRIVDGPTREALLKRVISRGLSVHLQVAARTPGFTRLITRLAADCAVDAAGGPIRDESDLALLGLIEDYRRELNDSGLVEGVWLGDLIASAPPTVEGPIGVMRFDSLADDELRLLVGLSHVNDVTVALTWEHMFAPTMANDRAVAYLAGIAAHHVRVVESPAKGEIQALARALYVGPAAIPTEGDVIVGLASGREAEAALIARFAADEIADGVAAERIVIAFPKTARRIDLLATALLSHGISAEFDVSEPFLTTSLGRAWLALLSLAVGAGGRREALTYIASPYAGVSRQAVHELDRGWRKARVGEPATLLVAISRLGDRCASIVDLVQKVARKTLTPDTALDWQASVDELLIAATADMAGRPVGRAAAQDAAAHQALSRALAQMASAISEPLGAAEVLAAVSAIRVGERSEETPGRVQVCDFRRVGARRFDAVILGGLTDDELSLASRESIDERLRDHRSRELEGEAGDRLRLEFYSLVSRARRRVYLVRQEADSEGRERRASALWEDALDAYRPLGSEIEDASAAPVPCVRLARADIEQLAPALTQGRRRQRELAGQMRFRTVERGAVLSPEGRSALKRASVFSATEVEAYLACPYRWFYERIVRPEEIDGALDARELGTHAHRLLAAFYRRVSAMTAQSRVTPEWLDEALQLFSEVAATDRGMAPAGLSEAMQTARAVAWARNVVAQDALFLPGFVPELVEFDFGTEPVFSFAGHAFRGRIDRIDTCPSSVFVTDYKSSRDVTKLEKLEAEGKIQMVIYACAAEQTLGKPVSGSVYRSMRSGRLRGFWRDDLLAEMPAGMCEEEALGADEFAALVARTETRVQEAIEGMRAGRVPREPAIKGACTYCSISLICEGARA